MSGQAVNVFSGENRTRGFATICAAQAIITFKNFLVRDVELLIQFLWLHLF